MMAVDGFRVGFAAHVAPDGFGGDAALGEDVGDVTAMLETPAQKTTLCMPLAYYS